MRFDDSLSTVLAADTSSAFGARAAFRQLVDLLARGRVPADEATLAELRALRPRVPAEVRAASARGLVLAEPPAELVAFFADDEPGIAASVLRVARIDDAALAALAPRIGPRGRAALRERRDLGPDTAAALERFASTDFALSFEPAVDDAAPQPEPAPAPAADPAPAPPPAAPLAGAGPFVALGEVARELPVVAEARRRQAGAERGGGSDISDLVERIEAFRRSGVAPAPAVPAAPARLASFTFETDAAGAIAWTDAAPRGPLIGLSIAHAPGGAEPSVDGVAAGAFRRRAPFGDARLVVAGSSAAGGHWRIAGSPLFEPASGRFLGYRGSARRARRDEDAAAAAEPPSEALRRLVHELRTPTNAIAGFAELIETELLGPVPAPYRAQAATIRAQVSDLIGAIDDLDLAARIEGAALDLRDGEAAVAPLIHAAAAALAPLLELRGSVLTIAPIEAGLAVRGEARLVERLIARLLAALASAGARGERIGVRAGVEGDTVQAVFDRPAALARLDDEALLSLDAEREAEVTGAPLLGAGFALRLARNLARELGGALTIGAGQLTLWLPAARAAADLRSQP